MHLSPGAEANATRKEKQIPPLEAAQERGAQARMTRVRVGMTKRGVGEPVLFCWSGGKDSAMALYRLQRDGVTVSGLLTTITEGYERVSMHGVRRELLMRQAEQIGLPFEEVRIPPQCVNPIYEERMEAALCKQRGAGVRRVAFGDIFLEDLREYRERNLARVGMEAIFPIWKQDTRELAREFCEKGFRAITVCIDARKLERRFAGRELTTEFFADLPEGVDPCGENGEFHTFVFDGPIFRKAIGVERGEVVEREGFTFCDLKEKTHGREKLRSKVTSKLP